jgi:hypothetical protein
MEDLETAKNTTGDIILRIKKEKGLQWNGKHELFWEVGQNLGELKDRIVELHVESQFLREHMSDTVPGLQKAVNWIGDLPRLEMLSLPSCQMGKMPESFKKLSNLRELRLSGNWMTALPDWIGDLKALRNANFSGNQIESIPDSFGQLKNLEQLSFNGNKLQSLHPTIGNLSKLKVLKLTENMLEGLPESIGGLVSLKQVYLEGNPLTQLPASIQRLQLILLDLTSCRLVEQGEGGMLGWRQLRSIFRDRVVLDQDQLLESRGSVLEVQEEELYARLDTQILSINRNVLRQYIPSPLMEEAMTGKQALQAFKPLGDFLKEKGDVETLGVPSNFLPKTKTPQRLKKFVDQTLTGYLNALFDLSNSPATGNYWLSQDAAARSEQRKQVSFILKGLAAKATIIPNDQRIHEDELMSSLLLLVHGFTHCPDGQVASFDHLLNGLQGREDYGESFEARFAEAVSLWKETCFEQAILPGGAGQNVHVLNVWKDTLRKDLGLQSSAYQSKMGTFGGDPFQGYKGNALESFYNVLTPQALITWFHDWVNNNYAHNVRGAIQFLVEKKVFPENVEAVHEKTGKLQESLGNTYFDVENDGYGDEYLSTLSRQGAQKILVEPLKLLVEKPASGTIQENMQEENVPEEDEAIRETPSKRQRTQ